MFCYSWFFPDCLKCKSNQFPTNTINILKLNNQYIKKDAQKTNKQTKHKEKWRLISSVQVYRSIYSGKLRVFQITQVQHQMCSFYCVSQLSVDSWYLVTRNRFSLDLIPIFCTHLCISFFTVFQKHLSYLLEMVDLTTVTSDWPIAPTSLEKLGIEGLFK